MTATGAVLGVKLCQLLTFSFSGVSSGLNNISPLISIE